MPAEWEPHAATWLSWPRRTGISFPDAYDQAMPAFRQIVNALRESEPVRINVYDAIGIQSDTQNWLFEAEWTDAGARCVSTQRVIDLKNVFGTLSSCVLLRTLPLLCGLKSDFQRGVLLMNEYDGLYLGL